MYCCVIIDNMIVNELRPLEGYAESYDANMRVGDDIEFCVEREGGLCGVERDIIAAISGVSQFLSENYEYMRTQKWLFEHVVN